MHNHRLLSVLALTIGCGSNSGSPELLPTANVAGAANTGGDSTTDTSSARGGALARGSAGRESNAATNAGGGTGNAQTLSLGGAGVGGNTTIGVATSTGGTPAITTCPDTGGPTMVLLPQGYCIDSTEVTRAQYQIWLNTNPTALDQNAECLWNISFSPNGNWSSPNTNPDFPVTYVDWCDAYAYCKGVGKRLCGRIGGGTNAHADWKNPALSQWHAACTSNGKYYFPYGNNYSLGKCNDYSRGDVLLSHGPVVAGSSIGCQSPDTDYLGVYDLNGNVEEWEDSCVAGSDGLVYCRVRGGSWGTVGYSNGDTYCGSPISATRDYTSSAGGFRCCAP